MKKVYFLLFIALLSLSFYSCKKDSAEKKTTKITGEWRVDYRVFEFYAGGKLIDTNTESYNNDNPESASLNEDGTGDFKEAGEAYAKFTYTVSGEKINFTNVSRFINTKWETAGDFQFSIIKLNANELYYATEGPIASPSLYDTYITRTHLVK